MNDILIPLAAVSTGISVTCATLYFVYALQMVKIETSEDEEAKELPLIFRLFMPFTPNFISMARHETFDNAREPLNEKIVMAGYENIIDADSFIALKFVITIFGALSAVLIMFSGKPVMGIIFLLVLYIYPDVWLKKTIQKRHLSIQRALPNFLDLLTLSV